VADMQAFVDRNYLSPQDADNLLKSGRTYNYYTYDNQTDNYAQDHFQLIMNHRLTEAWNLDLNAHYTYGRGYYEEFKPAADLINYGFANSLRSVDVIRRKWLDNDFYGSTFALNYTGSQKIKFTFGGAWNRYVGRHFGVLQDPFPGREWYRSRSQKTDLNLYAKGNINLSAAWNAYVDVQYRTVGYRMFGTADKFLNLNSDNSYSFFNPKFGLTHQLSEKSKVYGSVSAGSKEPSRQDFVDNAAGNPRPEYLQDYEVGYERSGRRYGLQINGYFMNYQDQLVLTGAVNSTGDAIRTNVESSYRLGVETMLNVQISKRLVWSGNVTLSQNRIQNFKERMTDYDTYDQIVINHGNTDIAYSPSVIAGNTVTYSVGSFEASLLSKYVGKQYLDNTSDEARSLEAYTTQDIRLKYTLKKGPVFTLLLNNVLNEQYSSNGYTYSYRYGGATTTENFYYPQAGFNFLLGASIRF
jgi:iron complex outermembrane receptor protein